VILSTTRVHEIHEYYTDGIAFSNKLEIAYKLRSCRWFCCYFLASATNYTYTSKKLVWPACFRTALCIWLWRWRPVALYWNCTCIIRDDEDDRQSHHHQQQAMTPSAALWCHSASGVSTGAVEYTWAWCYRRLHWMKYSLGFLLFEIWRRCIASMWHYISYLAWAWKSTALWVLLA